MKLPDQFQENMKRLLGEAYAPFAASFDAGRRNALRVNRLKLTSEQFEGEELCYENNPEQFREVHFAKEEKRQRYELLKKRLAETAGAVRATPLPSC